MLEFDLYENIINDFDVMDDGVNDGVIEVKERFKVKNLESCNWVFRKLKSVQKDIDEVEEFYKNELDRLNEWKEKEIKKNNDKFEFFKGLLIEYLIERRKEDSKYKISTPIGKLSSRKSPDKYVIQNKEKLIKWLKDNDKKDIIKIKEDVNISDVKKEFQLIDNKLVDNDSGEVVPYIDIIDQGENYVLKLN